MIREKNIWGVPERHKNTIAKVKLSDKFLIYLKQERDRYVIKEPRIVAVYDTTSEVFKASKRTFKTSSGMDNETFPLSLSIPP